MMPIVPSKNIAAPAATPRIGLLIFIRTAEPNKILAMFLDSFALILGGLISRRKVQELMGLT